jgi:hypothetical protein
MSSLAALPVTALTIVGLLFAVLGLFNAAMGVAALGVLAMAAAGLIGALGSGAMRD